MAVENVNETIADAFEKKLVIAVMRDRTDMTISFSKRGENTS